MQFEIKERSGYLPELQYGCTGYELSCFIPDSYEWKQINYGQGEGQVLIDFCEWGFYYTDNDSLIVVLHEGVILLNEAVKFIELVVKKVFTEKSGNVDVLLVGDSKE
jgi:hypothetical protein